MWNPCLGTEDDDEPNAAQAAAQAQDTSDPDSSNAPPQDTSADDNAPTSSGQAAADSGEWHKADPSQLPQQGNNKEASKPKPPVRSPPCDCNQLAAAATAWLMVVAASVCRR